jgi:aspartyl-tRNA(Asn)/glutamyl-tRNA(Gln) amidotransferase subunit B
MEFMEEQIMSYQLVCGLETHAELATKSKMFCSCKNDPFGAPAPNTYTCPVCLGMPGALPVANRQAIEWTIKLGLALNCKINLFSKFDRKNYFYADLPKGYQISQYDIPFCYDGYLETSEGLVRIHRIHLEEDTAKLSHHEIDLDGDGKMEKVSLVDFNRSSVPLVEIVTEADIISPTQAKEYGQKLRALMRYLQIADCDMEKGGMRLEANISLRTEGAEGLPNYKVECKNINSFRFLEQAINFEMQRQAVMLDDGQTPVQETRGYNPETGKTFSQRSKEDAEDYRYFPDPDLPPIEFTAEQIEKWRAQLPELPAVKTARWQQKYQLKSDLTTRLVESRAQADFFESLFEAATKAQIDLQKLVNSLVNKKITYELSDEVADVLARFQAANQSDSVDEGLLDSVIERVIAANADAIEKYKSGKTAVLGFLLGQIMRELGKKVDPSLVRERLLAKID